MSVFIVLLRAVNVGGTGKLPMAELTAMCLEVGFLKAQTCIASGNVVVETVRTVVIFLHEALPANALRDISGKKDEELVMTEREIYVHYGQGITSSRLKIPTARNGTGRNMNTVARLIELAGKMQNISTN
jgi:uncharacterized protein (DUF1697 family)